jgi:hypothetical protein
MKRILSLLLVALMILGTTAYSDVAFAQGRDGNLLSAAAFDDEETPAAEESPEAENTLPAEEMPEVTDDAATSPDIDFAAMTPQELYEYLLTLSSEEEIQAVLSLLTTEQLAALEAYRQAMEEGETAEDPVVPAINYTEAGPLLDPVTRPSLLKAQSFNGQTMDTAAEEDELILSKSVSSNSNGAYKLTLEAYATGEVNITTGNPLPTDIIMVLDVSGTMNSNMSGDTTNTRIDALKYAAINFINTVAAKSTTALKHRIAVVLYSQGSSIISGDETANGAFINAYDNPGGITTLVERIGEIKKGNGPQQADAGLQDAIEIFRVDSATGTRNRAVVFLGNGTPTTDLNISVQKAQTLKASPASGYGATVYTVGIFNGANPTTDITSASNDDKFMHFVSSNYPDAVSMTNYGTGSNAGYYLSASNTAKLNEIFQNIADKVEGGTTVTLDEAAVVKDVLSPYFTLPAGADTRSIKLYTAGVVQGSTTLAWQPPVLFNDGTVTISPDGKTIGVSGFDYSEQYVAPVKRDDVITGYRGTKLIIEIPIVYKQGSCFGGTVPTNTAASGIYNENTCVEAFTTPTVDIPVNYDFTPVNQSIYLSEDARLDGTFANLAGYIADGVNNAYVNIVYTVSSGGGPALGTYTIPAGQTGGEWDISDFAVEGLTANTGFTVGCTVTPVSGPVPPGVMSKPVMVYVWTPYVTWRDSVICLGETADYDDNFVSVLWKNASDSVLTPVGTEPVLQYQYTPAVAAFAGDTLVKATVKIGGIDVTAYTHFAHEECSYPDCGFNAALGEFMVHVKTCSLTITKEGAADPTDTFIFKVTGGGLTLLVSVQGNGSQTIVGLPAGSYTITEEAAWSWRYTASGKNVSLSTSNSSGTVTISNAQTNDKWLGGDSRTVNTFSNAS